MSWPVYIIVIFKKLIYVKLHKYKKNKKQYVCKKKSVCKMVFGHLIGSHTESPPFFFEK